MQRHDWDAIVIGSGLGGLTAAAYLATNGLRTLVLEQWDVVGGSSHVFRRKRKWEFDVGVHYLGDCGEGGLIPTVLTGVGLGRKIEFLPMDPDGFDTLIYPDLTFRVPKGWDRYMDRLVATFPSERRGLERCVKTMRDIARELTTAGAPKGTAQTLLYPLKAPKVVRWHRATLKDLFDACGLSPEARAVLAGESGDYASPPSRASLLLHAALMDHYLRDGAFYPKGGGQVLAAHLTDVIRTHGGEVRTRARVERIRVDRGRVSGVELRGGESFRAATVISNADLKKTLLELVGPEHISSRTVQRTERYRMAPPILSVYLGLTMDLSNRMPNTNFWVHADYDQEASYRACMEGRLPDKTSAFITAASVKDPHTPHIAPPGCSSLEVMTVVPPHHSFWKIGQGPAKGEKYSRSPDYREVKDELTERAIEVAEGVIGQLRQNIDWQETSTPITHERYTLASGGTSYGLELSPNQFGPRRPGPRTEIEGLYLAGASTVFGHGIAGVMSGGIGCAGAVLRRDLLSEVRSGRVFADTTKLTAGGPDWDPLDASRRLSKTEDKTPGVEPSPELEPAAIA